MSYQENNYSPIEQLYYTWSAIGLDSISAGFRVRAASRALSDVGSPRVQALDRYLRYVLPEGTDRFAITPEMAPPCLSLIQSEQRERILVYKTYTGKDGFGRLGAFFIHMLVDVPPDFSPLDAILLWRTDFWKKSEESIPKNQLVLDPFRPDEVLSWRRKELDIINVQAYLPFLIQAYLTRLNYQRLYIAAPADAVASLIYGLTRCLPRPLLKGLTFSTYENDILSKDQVLLVGTCWDQSVSAKYDLPPTCYEENQAINCISGKQSQLASSPPIIAFANYATQCLVTGNFIALDRLFSKIAGDADLNVSGFLQAYDSYIVKAQNPTQKDVEFYLSKADAEMLSGIQVQELILMLAMRDQQWLNNFLNPHLTSLFQQKRTNSELADALAQLAKAASQKAAMSINADNVIAFNTMLNLAGGITSSRSDMWQSQVRLFAAQPNIQSFLAKHPDAHFQLLELWNRVTPQPSIGQGPFLTVQERNFEDFYSRNLQSEWKDIATRVLTNSAIAEGAVAQLGQKYQRPVAALMEHLSQNSWHEAVALFEQLAERGYPHKIHLLSVLLNSPLSSGKGEEEALLKKAHLKESESEKFLAEYGPQYLLSPQREAIILKVFRTFARSFPGKRMSVLQNWLRSTSLTNWFEALPDGPVNLERVLQAAALVPDESNMFLESYGRRYLESYSKREYQPSPLFAEYLKRYVDSFNPKALWRASSPAREFLLFLGSSPVQQSLSVRERQKVQQYCSINTFLQQPSTQIISVRALGTYLQELRSDRDLQLIESLAAAFASCIESETELASVTYMMSTILTDAELLQMLYGMAEHIRDGMVSSNAHMRKQAEALLLPCIQFALCFDSIYDFSPGGAKLSTGVRGLQPEIEEKLFLRTLLYILLQNAHQDTINWIALLASQTHDSYWQKWNSYKPTRSSTPAYVADAHPPRPVQARGRSGHNLKAFLAQMSTGRKDLEDLRSMLAELRATRTLQPIEDLAATCASRVESETELTAITQVLGPLLKKDLLQVLYAMAEIIRDGLASPETKRSAEGLLELYIRFVLCFESVFALSSDEHMLFVRSFLNLLLQSADDDTFQQLYDRTRSWPGRLLRQWQTYMSQDVRALAASHNKSRNGQRRFFTRAGASPAPTLEGRGDPGGRPAAHAAQRQTASSGKTPSSASWFSRLLDWLAEDVLPRSGPTKLKKRDKQL